MQMKEVSRSDAIRILGDLWGLRAGDRIFTEAARRRNIDNPTKCGPEDYDNYRREPNGHLPHYVTDMCTHYDLYIVDETP